MRISEDCKVRIPVAIMDKLGLMPGTNLEFSVFCNRLIVKKAKVQDRCGKAIVESIKGRATNRITTDDIMRRTRGD